MLTSSGLVLAATLTLQAAAGPPIFHPGAPGTAARTVTPAEAVELSRTGFTVGDIRFMQHMMVHHAQAVEMVALLQAHGADPVVGRLGQRIALGQQAEMDLMEAWLASRDQPVATPMMDHAGMNPAAMDHSAHAGAAPMPGMLTPAQMQALGAARGADFDRLFLSGMIQHHQGALDMVDMLMDQPDAARDPVLSDFASSVVADQSAEILRMQTLLSSLSNPPLKERP